MRVIREERIEDIAAIRHVHEEAFGQPQEADLVDSLRRSCRELLSLVAVADGRLVGHILFSPASISAAAPAEPAANHFPEPRGLGLGPMAVRPGFQGRGIGSALVRRGLSLAEASGAVFVVVLGHPQFYPRFDFEPAWRRGIGCPWEGVPEEAFMVLVLDSPAMAGVSGTARYRAEFDAAM